MIRATAVDNLKLEHLLLKMSKLEYLRVESESFSRMESVIFSVINDRTLTLHSLFLVDNKEHAGAKSSLEHLSSLCIPNSNGEAHGENRMEVESSTWGPDLIHFGCRLDDVIMTPVLKNFLRIYRKIRIFEVWTDETVLKPQFLFDMFAHCEYLRKVVVHCGQYDKTFTRTEVEMYQRRKLKRIVFFPD